MLGDGFIDFSAVHCGIGIQWRNQYFYVRRANVDVQKLGSALFLSFQILTFILLRVNFLDICLVIKHMVSRGETGIEA